MSLPLIVWDGHDRGRCPLVPRVILRLDGNSLLPTKLLLKECRIEEVQVYVVRIYSEQDFSVTIR